MPCIQNGISPTYVTPSRVSGRVPAGRYGWTRSGGTAQCTNASSAQRWVKTVRPAARGASGVIGSGSTVRPFRARTPTARRTTAGGDQLVVRAELGDHPVLHHGHPVGVVRGEEPVRDRDHGATVEDGGQRALEVPGGARVDQRGRLVEDQRVRVGEHEAGERDLLGLGGGQARPPEPTTVSSPAGSASTHSSASTASSAPWTLVVGRAAGGPGRGSPAACRRRRGAPG